VATSESGVTAPSTGVGRAVAIAAYTAKISATVATWTVLTVAIQTFALRFRTGAYSNFSAPFPDHAQLLGMTGRAVDMVALTLADIADTVMAHGWILPLVLLAISVRWWRRRWPPVDTVLTRIGRWRFLAAASVLSVLLMVFPGSIHDQLTQPVFPRLQRSVSNFNIEDALNRKYERLQACSRVGDNPHLDIGGISCGGPPDGKQETAQGHLRDTYVFFVVVTVILAWLYWRKSMTFVGTGSHLTRGRRPALFFKSLSLGSLLLIPWVYGTFRANIGMHGAVHAKNCEAYLLEAGNDWIVIYQSSYKESPPRVLGIAPSEFTPDTQVDARSDAVAERLKLRLGQLPFPTPCA
jgi:hypothetical protein